MNYFPFWAAIAAIFFSLTASEPPARPRITGIAHVRLYSTNLSASSAFYGHIVGLAAAPAGCLGPTSACFTVNPRQRVELVAAATPPAPNFLAEVAFATDNLQQMHRYLIAHKITVGAISKSSAGQQHFELTDPDGQPLAFVQQSSTPTATPAASATPATPAASAASAAEQVSSRLIHAGFVVRDGAAEDRFYRDLLGFRLYWRGGFKDDGVNWQAMQVPDGEDWVEYMLNISPTADHQELGVQNHFSLGVTAMKPAVDRLKSNGLQTTDAPEIGRDGKMQFDIFDPDATRVEFMEFEPTQPTRSPTRHAQPHPPRKDVIPNPPHSPGG
jgi:catechol 2,3-dioxygenase-like lactoylglutathione lyase family enzyme